MVSINFSNEYAEMDALCALNSGFAPVGPYKMSKKWFSTFSKIIICWPHMLT